jgi:hypothetical protein
LAYKNTKLILSYEYFKRSQAMADKYLKVKILENEIEALLLDSILHERSIPHMVVSYHDTAYNGLYQTQKGWGYVKAPIKYHNEISEIMSQIRKS